jgi:hypothetical protein
MQADPGAEPVPFPAYCPERRFVLTGSEMLIGRRSRSRGIEPAIDLTGPPEDTGASHVHALLVSTPEGRWTIVDLDSANGTYVNDSADPIAANQPVPLAPGPHSPCSRPDPRASTALQPRPAGLSNVDPRRPTDLVFASQTRAGSAGE